VSEHASPHDWLEDISSLLPAVTLLQNLGYTYLSPAEALACRGGKCARVVLENILTDWLRKHNSFEMKGKTHCFSDANIQRAVEAVSQHPFDAINTTSQALYDLITLGKSFEETVQGDKKSFTLQYIDWKHPENNVLHVTDEFEVERRGSTQTRRPDLVVFVNGIPLVVVECKRPDLKDAVDAAISQHLRNHRPDEVPDLFCLSQLLLAVSQNAAKYGTTATDREFWAVWKEEDTAEQERELLTLVNTPLSEPQKARMLSWREPWQQNKLKSLWASGDRLVTPQDRALHSLLRPERLLDLIQGFIVFDAGIKKVARYQQYFAIKATLERVKSIRGDERRRGGVIWHTTGSGKSLTMVMLAKALALDPSIRNPKIILVNDRIDLDEQLKDTFKNCGAEVYRANSGKHLLELMNKPQAEIITTVIDKFETVAKEKVKNESRDIFVLVDESHRSQYGKANALMEAVFPNACYIGFTGTPLLKKEKSTAQKFGGFIHAYTMPQAVADGAVVPLLYEGRDSAFRNTQAVDTWFERITRRLNDQQKADLKRKFRSAEPLYDADARLAEIAYDIGRHFSETFKNTPFKGQFAVSSKAVALKYKRLFDEFGDVTTEVIISAPDTREDNDSVDEADVPEVQRFWKDMMARHGSPEAYQRNLIKAFKHGDKPEILIVVDKLLTGFDAPRNRVLYLDKRLKEHSILQAIARVNRVFSGENPGDTKDFGLIIDYRGIFGELNDALELYAALEREGFDAEDIRGALTNVSEEIAKLPTRHASVWDSFKGVVNKQDTEAMQQHLQPQDRREAFYEALQAFAKTLQLALANTKWLTTTPEDTQTTYTKDLKYFLNLRAAVKQRYAESVDYSAYEAQLRNIITQQIGAEEVKTLIEPVSIFEVDKFDEELEQLEGSAAKADAIAARVKKVITERMEEDPTLYKKLSELIQEAIDAHRAKRLSDAEYLKRMREHLETARTKGASSVPHVLTGREEARAYYGVLKERLSEHLPDEDTLAAVATRIEDAITQHKVRDWQHNTDAQNRMLNDIDDLFHELRKDTGIRIPYSDLDEVVGKIMNIAKVRDA
jgi:type I restriction enzyme R subunit